MAALSWADAGSITCSKGKQIVGACFASNGEEQVAKLTSLTPGSGGHGHVCANHMGGVIPFHPEMWKTSSNQKWVSPRHEVHGVQSADQPIAAVSLDMCR